MSYDAVLEGASGLWYFVYTYAADRRLSDLPEYWHALTEVAREISFMRPIWERGKEISLSTDNLPDGIKMKGWRHNLRDYIVIANGTEQALDLPPALLDPYWRPLFESRRRLQDLLTQMNGKPQISRYRILVLESRLSPTTKLRTLRLAGEIRR